MLFFHELLGVWEGMDKELMNVKLVSEYVPQRKSGLLDHDQKALGSIHTGSENLIVLTNNNAETQLLRSSYQERDEYVALEPMEASLEIIPINGKTERMEIGYGGGYLTQSSRGFFVPKNEVKEIHVYDFSGKRTRTINTTGT